MPALVATVEEIEQEQAAADYLLDRDEARFRAAMARLGYSGDEIDERLEALRT